MTVLVKDLTKFMSVELWVKELQSGEELHLSVQRRAMRSSYFKVLQLKESAIMEQ